MNEMAKQDWWSRTSAADDGEIETEDSYLSEFDFGEYASEDEGDFVGGLWNRYGTRSADKAIRTAQALRLVQGFVDTFATGDKPYRVTFDESIGTAGTDFLNRAVVISHEPLFDSTIDDATAETVLTAMAAHESSHVRYGRRTSAAVRKELTDPRAPRVSNILDDVRIERRFTADYPGYSHVFAPAIKYVAESGLRKAGAETYVARKLDPVSVLVGAVRYPAFVDWTDRETIRDRWTEWAVRGTRDDRIATHVEAVREALAMLDEPQPEPEPTETKDGGSEQDAPTSDGGEGGSGGSSEQDSDGGSRDGEQDQTTSGSGSDESETDGTESLNIPDCFADGIDAAAESNDADAAQMDSATAQTLAEQAKALTEIVDSDDYGDIRGEVYWGPRGIARKRSEISTDGASSAAIRSAFARSRTGHYATTRNLKSGRLDSRGLSRIAQNDYRLFNRRSAPSEGRYNVWLMVDCSTSMIGYPSDGAAQVARALAAASRSIPALRLSIWGWTTAFRMGARFGAVRVWTSGETLANVGYLPSVPKGGTPDRETLLWAVKAIQQDSRPGETPVILLASDGEGTLRQDPSVVADARRHGVAVVSVALGRLNPDNQRAMYGEHGYLPWTGSIRTMARPLGELLARVVTGRSMDR